MTLETALLETMNARSSEDYQHALMRMLTASRDGHGYVFGLTNNAGGLPIRLARCGERLVVTGSLQEDLLQKGDVLLSLDGVDALAALERIGTCTPGSPQLSEFRALNQFGAGPVGSVAHIELLRSGKKRSVDVLRTKEACGYFFKSIAAFSHPTFAEIRPGLYYVNLQLCEKSLLEEKMPELATAKGIIFDWRHDGRHAREGTQFITPDTDIIPHLIDAEVQASPMRIPLITQPDRADWKYQEWAWPISPKTPRLKARIVFINEPCIVSHGETCMAVIAGYHLASLVGSATAGCNGGTNFINVPGGLQVMWTGIEVLKHDHSPFYLTGFKPDYPVSQTQEALLSGRDEALEQAISVIEKP